MANEQIRFSELPDIGINIQAGDIFALSVTSGPNSGVSHKIQLSDLGTSIVNTSLSDSGSDANLKTLISGLNSVTSDNSQISGNGLNASGLHDGGAYRSGSFYRDYTNLNNRPFIPEDLVDLTNDHGYIRYNDATGTLVWADIQAGKDNNIIRVISTDNVPEGVQSNSNLYYTNQRVENYLDQNFSRFLNERTLGFDDGNAVDSVIGVSGVFVPAGSTSAQITIDDMSLFNSFRVNDTLRIYGGSLDQETDDLDDFPSFNPSVTYQGFGGGGGTDVTLEYSVALFDLRNGKYTQASPIGSVALAVPSGASGSALEGFNSSNFVSVTLTGIPQGKGALIYRRIQGEATYRLVAVLGTKDTSSSNWIDYYTFDYVSWSGKLEADNSYMLENTVHFSTNAPTAPQRGWTDVNITNIVDNGNATFSLIISEPLYFNASLSCQICHNDTNKIQGAINTNGAAGLKAIRVNAKRYVTDKIVIPSSFGIIGTPSITKLARLPWSGGDRSESKIIEVDSAEGSNQISLTGFDIEGEHTNQILFNDSGNIRRNYAIDLGDLSEQIILDKVRVFDVIGGGIYASRSISLKINTCEVRNSNITDRHSHIFSPLITDSGTFTLITSSIFENFSDYVDVSLSNKGIITSNIISNCGSGLFAYGSQFFLTSQNILSGPANEFLPGPDVYNSEYDSVNITVEADTQFNSPVYKYQENGFDFSLKSDTRNNIIYEVFKLKKSAATGAETLYEEITNISLNDVVDSTVNPEEGDFQFTITQQDVNTIISSYDYDTLSATEPDHIGLVYRASLEEYVPAGVIQGGTKQIVNTNLQFIATDVQYISVGVEISIDSPGFDATQNRGTVVSVSTPGGNPGTATIEVDFGTINSIGTGGGTINRINKFTLAKGRILQ